MSTKRDYKLLLALMLGDVFAGCEVKKEYRFHPARRWRFDWAIPELMLAVEYDGHGGTGGGHIGRHASVVGMAGDCEKINSAICAGWQVLRFTALFFSESSRAKNKLSHPLDTLKAAKATALIAANNRSDTERMNWLADPRQRIGNVLLPTPIVERNLGSLRDSIDATMKLENK